MRSIGRGPKEKKSFYVWAGPLLAEEWVPDFIVSLFELVDRPLFARTRIDDNVLHLMSGIPSANCVFEPGEQCANVREPFQAVEILESGFVCFVL